LGLINKQTTNMKKLDKFLVALYAFNCIVSIFTGNVPAICGWLCATFAQLGIVLDKY
jgi:hypothetical protein